MPYNHDAMARSSAGSKKRGAAKEDELPVDEHVVMPESGAELLEGRLRLVAGAEPPHATRHLALAYVLGAHVGRGFEAAVDLLTRTSATSNFAPDASIYPSGRDPKTGGRKLEVLAFEIVSKQRLSVASRKAKQLVRRGVRRVFALVVARDRLLEWDRETKRWRPMHLEEAIDDACLVRPLPIRALLESARSDEAVLAALAAKRPELLAELTATARAEGRAEGHAEGRAEGHAEGHAEGRAAALRYTVRALVRALAVEVPSTEDAWIERADATSLEQLAETLQRERRWSRP